MRGRRPQLGLSDPDGPQAHHSGLRGDVADSLSPLFECLHLLVFGHLEDGREHLLGRDRSLLDLLKGLPHLRHPIVGLLCFECVDNEFGLVATTNGSAVVAVGCGGDLL